MIHTLPILFAFLLIVVGAFVVTKTRLRKKELGIISKKRLYEDTDKRPGEILKSTILPLVGKPDYLIETEGTIIPVEVKTGKTPVGEPRIGHVFQLIAYCHLVEEDYNVRPEYGIVKYPEKEYIVQFSDEYENQLGNLVESMMKHKNGKKLVANYFDEFLCRGCKSELAKDYMTSSAF